MKKFLSFFILFFVGIIVFAQAPQKLSYQAVVRNANNALVANSPVGVKISILQDNTNGTPIYVETQTVTTNANGLLTLQIGDGSVVSGNMASIDWAAGPYFLKTETDPNGGSNYTIEGVQQMLSVPYALFAETSGNDFSGDYNDLINTPEIPTVPTVVSAFTNDAHYITEGELQQTVNTIDGTIGTINNDMADMSNAIDSLQSHIDELEGYHTPPMVMTTGVEAVSYHTATLNGSVIFIGGAPVAARGFCYDTVMHPTVESNVVNCGSGSGSFSTNLLNLNSATTYYLRAYATNMWGTNYGEEIMFTTLTELLPSVEIMPATDISFTSFSCQGVVTDSGSYAVTARGLCWSTTPDPVMTGDHLHLGSGTGSFSSILTNMQPETTYYLRAYAVNAAGTAYSTPITVTTLTPTLATVTTDSVSMYNECTGTVLSDGGAPVTQRGFCYDTLPNPTIESGIVIAGNGLGEFIATLTGLPIGKLYFVRAFATNAKGTAYGNQFDFHAGCDTKTVTDYDGNVYNTVIIGAQCWLKENLRATHYSDGWPLEYGITYSNTTGYYYYPNNNVTNTETYGLLYNWKAIMRDAESSDLRPSGVQGICPTGWHVPSASEWNDLTNYVGSQVECWCNGNSARIAKALADSIGWNESSSDCAIGNDFSTNNTTGFSLRGAGRYSGYYHNMQDFNAGCYLWTSTVKTSYPEGVYWRLFTFSSPSVSSSSGAPSDYYAISGYSLRCLRDY